MHLDTAVPKIYRWLLRLYPATFRETFADEMAAVFAEAWAQASRGNAAIFCLREIAALLVEAGRERALVTFPTDSSIAQARAIIRTASLLFGLFYVGVTYQSGPLFMRIATILLFGGVLAACRWEQRGGLVTCLSALASGALMAFTMTMAPGFPGVLWLALIPALLFPLPFLLFGAMFTVLNRRACQAA